jgi:YcaO-like protein with predicted kinase domain
MTRRAAAENSAVAGCAGPWPRLDEITRKLGITRLADITGLDTAGIPVVQAVRPFSLSNAVSQGKGQTLEAATISAVFESVESFLAERLESFDITFASADALSIPVDRFQKYLLDGIAPDWHRQVLPWIEAKNFSGGRSEMVPLELVHTAYVLPHHVYDGVFAASTTGLAAAFKAEDAILHGLLECIERDAIARAHMTHGFLQRRRIDPRSIEDSDICNLLETLRHRGFLVGLWHVPSPTGVPVIWCHLMEDREAGSALLPLPAEGSAARPSAVAAINHAIYEAAQSRLTAISGARDDFTRSNYPKYPDLPMLAAHRLLLAEGPREVNFQALPVEETFDTARSISVLLSKLGQSGHHNVFEIPLDNMAPIYGIVGTKIIIPSLLPLLES